MFEMFIFWLGFTVAVGLFAHHHRGRNAFGWVVLSLLISPLLAGVLLLCMPRLDARRRPEPELIDDAAHKPAKRAAKLNWHLDARRVDDIARIQGIIK